MKKSLWILAALLFCLGFTAPQSRTITGKVTSGDDGKGMPGVNVVVKGTKNGTVTDAKGIIASPCLLMAEHWFFLLSDIKPKK